MKIEIDFYTEDPFEKEASFRLQGITSHTEDPEIYELFLKNMIAYVYYHTNIYHEDSGLVDFIGNITEVEQAYFYEKYIGGALQTGFVYNNYRSPLTDFCMHEFNSFQQDTTV